METIKQQDSGAAVEDVQHRLSLIGLLDEARVDGAFGPETAAAVKAFRAQAELPEGEEVDEKTWAALVDASYSLGDRTLYLRMPYFHGHDVLQLQQALSALGFACGPVDGMFGAFTELALRKFQTNLGLPTDGIAGAFTFRALLHLQHSWKGKDSFSPVPRLGFARAAQVLESNLICLFGTSEFTRSVAARMSNLALATTPASKVTSADSLLVAPDESMYFVQILVGNEKPASTVPTVDFVDEESLPDRVGQALMATEGHQRRIAVRLPEEGWEDAGADRSAQHYAIVLLDALCSGLVIAEQR